MFPLNSTIGQHIFSEQSLLLLQFPMINKSYNRKYTIEKTEAEGVNQEWTVQRHMEHWTQERL
jgi:hypothetical protein